MIVCTQKLTYAGRHYLESQLVDGRFCVGDSLESEYFSALPCRQTMSFESSLFKHNQIVRQNCGDYSQQKRAPVSRHICLMLGCDPYTHWSLWTGYKLLRLALEKVCSGRSSLSQWLNENWSHVSVTADHVYELWDGLSVRFHSWGPSIFKAVTAICVVLGSLV